MLKNPLKGGRRKKSLIAALSFLTALILLTFLLQNTNRPITVNLTSQENKFKVALEVPKSQQKALSKTLANFNLPQDLKEFEFKTDASSSAKLAFVQPIKAKINIDSKKIRISGSQQIPLETLQMEDVELPKSTNLAVFGTDLTEYLATKLSGQILPDWIKENSEKGQYFAIFGKDANYVLAAKSDESKLEQLKSLTSDESYKKEEADGISYHMIKLGENDLPESLVFFHQGGYLFLTQNLDSAKEVSRSQISGENFLFKAPKEPVSFYLVFENKDKVQEPFLHLILPDAKNVASYLSKVRSLDFSLKGNRFSALIILE